MPRHPTDGVKGSKPRFPGAFGNAKASKAEISQLNKEYLIHRNSQMRFKAAMAEMLAQEKHGELLSKARIKAQIADVFVALRQAILNFSPRYASRMVGLADEHAARQVLTEASREFLSALSELSPEKVLQHEEDEGGKPLRPATGATIRAEEAKAKIRRQKKAATMRRLRAKLAQGT